MNNQKENSVSLITSSRSPLICPEYLCTYDAIFPVKIVWKKVKMRSKCRTIGWGATQGEEKLGTSE